MDAASVFGIPARDIKNVLDQPPVIWMPQTETGSIQTEILTIE